MSHVADCALKRDQDKQIVSNAVDGVAASTYRPSPLAVEVGASLPRFGPSAATQLGKAILELDLQKRGRELFMERMGCVPSRPTVVGRSVKPSVALDGGEHVAKTFAAIADGFAAVARAIARRPWEELRTSCPPDLSPRGWSAAVLAIEENLRWKHPKLAPWPRELLAGFLRSDAIRSETFYGKAYADALASPPAPPLGPWVARRSARGRAGGRR